MEQNVPGSSLAQKPVCVVKEWHMMPRFQVTGSGKDSWLSKISERTNRDRRGKKTASLQTPTNVTTFIQKTFRKTKKKTAENFMLNEDED